MLKPVVIAAALLLGLLAAGASAQNVYRCGESYSNLPCPGATVVETDDARSAAQRAQTDAATRRDARTAQALERDRLRQEGQPAQAIIPLQVSEAPQAPAAKSLSSRPKRPEVFTAVAPKKPGDGATAKKKKARKPAGKHTAA